MEPLRSHLSKLILVKCAAISVLALAGCTPGSPADAYVSDPVALKRAQSIFVGTCAGYCHSSSPGLRDAPYLFDCVWLHGGTDEELHATISTGVPETRMVGFAGMLPEGDADIWRLVGFIRSKREAC